MLAAGFVVIVVGLVASALGDRFVPLPDLGGSIVVQPTASIVGDDVTIGACVEVPESFLADPEAGSDPHAWTVVACDDPHTGEFVFDGTYEAAAGDDYPTEAALNAYYDEHCVPAFEAFTDRSFEDATDIVMNWFAPSEETWQMGDREITCYLTAANGYPVSHSYRPPVIAPASSTASP